MKIKGESAEVWIDGEKIVGEVPWSLEVDSEDQKVYQTFAFSESLEDKTYLFKPKDYESTFTLTMQHDDELWESMLRMVGYQELRFFPHGNRWFCPWYELFSNDITPVGPVGGEFEISIVLPQDMNGPYWTNRWARPVHWLWAHLWVPLRRLVLRFRKSPPEPLNDTP